MSDVVARARAEIARIDGRDEPFCVDCHDVAVGVDTALVEELADELERSAAVVDRVRGLHWPSPTRDPACDCYDGLQVCPTIAALELPPTGAGDPRVPSTAGSLCRRCGARTQWGVCPVCQPAEFARLP